MSASLYVPSGFFCQRHKTQEIHLIDLTPGVKQSRLFCSECQCTHQSTIQPIETVFNFFSNIRINYLNIQKDIERIKRNISEIKIAYNKYFDDLTQKIDEWEIQIETNKLIKQDLLEKILERTQQFSTQSLQQYLEDLSDKIEIRNKEIKVKKPFFSDNDKQFKVKLTKKLQELTDFLKQQVVSEIHQKINQIEQNNQENIYQKKSEINFPNNINVLEFNRDGKLLGVGNQYKVDDCYFSIWAVDDQNKLSLIQRLKEHTKILRTICFSSQNNSIITGSLDNRAIFWKQKFSKEWVLIQIFENIPSINCLKFNHSADQIAIGTLQLQIWRKNHYEKWQKLQTMEDHKTLILCVNFNETDQILVSADQSQLILVSKYQENLWLSFSSLSCATQQINFLGFLNLDNFISISNNNEIIFWSFQQSIQEYECKIQKLDYKFTQACMSETQQLLALQNQDRFQMFEIKQNDLKYIQGIDISGSAIQVSRDGIKIAIFTESKLQIYEKQQ